jgi:hypothetical protein
VGEQQFLDVGVAVTAIEVMTGLPRAEPAGGSRRHASAGHGVSNICNVIIIGSGLAGAR